MGLGPETGRTRNPEGSPRIWANWVGTDSEALWGWGAVGGLVKDKCTVDVYAQPWR